MIVKKYFSGFESIFLLISLKFVCSEWEVERIHFYPDVWYWTGADCDPIPDNIPISRWVNPCGVSAEELSAKPKLNKDLTHTLLFTLVNALLNNLLDSKRVLLMFTERFANETFQADFLAHNNDWKPPFGVFDWLPEPQKNLGERITRQELLENVKLDDFVWVMSRDFEVLDIGLEQVFWNWNLKKDTKNPGYKKLFEEIRETNNMVMCSLYTIRKERGVPPLANDEDNDRSFMPDEHRYVEHFSQRSLRDWAILGSYLNTLEFAIEITYHMINNQNKAFYGQGQLPWLSKPN